MADTLTQFSPEQLKALREGVQAHDMTQTVSLLGEGGIPPERAETYKRLKEQVLGYMKADLPALGIRRPMENYGKDHPVNLLMNADASVIAEQAANVLSDEAQTADAFETFFDLFDPLIETAVTSYCTAKDKVV